MDADDYTEPALSARVTAGSMANFIYRQKERETLFYLAIVNHARTEFLAFPTPQATIDFRRKSFYNKLRNQETKK